MPAKDYKKELRGLYSGKAGRIDVVDVPPLKYLVLEGKGDPSTAFGPAMHALYAIAYPLKFAIRARDPSLDYVVMPPEALYPGQPRVYEGPRESWPWTLLVMQPVEPTAEELDHAIEQALAKGAPELARDVRLRTLKEARCLQTLHVGAYDAMGGVITAMREQARAQHEKPGGPHHEIYLSDPRRVSMARTKTLVRMPLAKRARRTVAPLR